MTSTIWFHASPAILSGLLAAAFLTAAPIFRSRRMILFAQLAAGLCFALHYALLGIPVAAGVNVLGSVQTCAALLSTRSAAMNRLGYALIVLMALVGLWFWQGPISGFSVVAMTLIALARMQSVEMRLRGLLLAGGCVWLVHDLLGNAWIAVAADIGAILMGIVAICSLLFRVTIEWRLSNTAQAVRA